MTDHDRASREFSALARQLERERKDAVEIVRQFSADPETYWDREVPAEWRTIGVAETLTNASGEILEADSRKAISLAHFAITVATSIPPEKYPRVMTIDTEAMAWKELANAHRYRSEYEAALRALDACDRLLADSGVLAWSRAVSLFARALVFSDLHRFEEAGAVLSESEQIFRVFKDRRRIGQCLLVRGMMEQRRGRLVEACGLYESAITLFRAANDLASLASALNNLGHARIDLNEPTSAVTALRDALTIFVELGATGEVARTRCVLGRLLLSTGRYQQAREMLTEARRILLTLGMVEEAGLAGLELVEVFLALRDEFRAQAVVEEVTSEFLRAKLNHRATTALAYLKEMLGTPRGSDVARHVKKYVAVLRQEPEQLFAPLPDDE